MGHYEQNFFFTDICFQVGGQNGHCEGEVLASLQDLPLKGHIRWMTAVVNPLFNNDFGIKKNKSFSCAESPV